MHFQMTENKQYFIFIIKKIYYSTMKPFTAILSCILHCTFNLCVSY